MAVKMVLVIRKDLKMRRGKEIAQACHGAVGAILAQKTYIAESGDGASINLEVDKPTAEWILGMFRKIAVVVNTEEEMLALKAKCDEAGVRTTLIEDNGLTEFHGEKTKTVLAIGPDYDEVLEPITGSLKLY